MTARAMIWLGAATAILATVAMSGPASLIERQFAREVARLEHHGLTVEFRDRLEECRGTHSSAGSALVRFCMTSEDVYLSGGARWRAVMARRDDERLLNVRIRPHLYNGDARSARLAAARSALAVARDRLGIDIGTIAPQPPAVPAHMRNGAEFAAVPGLLLAFLTFWFCERLTRTSGAQWIPARAERRAGQPTR